MFPGDRHLRKRGRRPEQPIFDPAGAAILLYFTVFCIAYVLSPNIIGALTLGWYLSLIIELPARFISKLKWMPYGFSVGISSLSVFALLIFGLSRIVPIILKEGQRLFPLLSKIFSEIDLSGVFSDSRFGDQLMKGIEDAGMNLMQKTAEGGVRVINSLLQRIPDLSTAMIIFIITAAYFTFLLPVFKKNLWRFLPASGEVKARHFLREVYNDVRHFIAGQMIIALCVGLLIWLGMLLSGIPYAMFIGFLSGVTNFIPYMGIVVAAVPSLLLGLSHGGLIGFIKVALVLVAVNQLDSWLLSPKIQGSRMKLNWFAIILSILISGTLLGLVGILLAIPLVVFFKRFWIWYLQESLRRL